MTFREGPADTCLERTGLPFRRGHIPSRPRPADPLPDSDEERQSQSEVLTLTPRSALLLTSSSDGEPKWWHVPDTCIQELVQPLVHTMESSATSPPADVSPHKLLRSTSCPSSTCRAMGYVGQLKKPARPSSGTWPLDSAQMDTAASRNGTLSLGSFGTDALREAVAGHVAPETFAASSTCLRDIQVRTAISLGMNWPLQNRQSLDNWSSPKRPWTDADKLLSQTKSSGGSSLGDSSGLLEQNKVGCLPGVTGPKAKTQRPATAPCSRSSSKLDKSATSISTNSGRSRPQSASGFSEHESDLIQIELAFKDNSDRIGVLIDPEALIGPDPASGLPDKMTLKGMIDRLTGMPPSKQRLLCKGFDVSQTDKMTLRRAGIADGNTVTVHLKRDLKQALNRDTVVLACTAKRLDKQQKLKQQDSRRASCSKESRREKKGTMVMPKWSWGVPPDNTKIGSGYNGLGGMSSFRFENHHIWHDTSEPAYEGLKEIRSHQAFTNPLEFASHGLSPHCQ